MTDEDKLLTTGLEALGTKPLDSAPQAEKKRYSEQLSSHVALAVAEALRGRGLAGTRPSPPGEASPSGAERRIAGGIGDKKVDVTWATEEAGLLLGVSIKSINFRDNRSDNFQKNMTNRRGDMLIEAVTLHRRFPYSVLAGLFFFDQGAATDDTPRRRSTFENTHTAFRLFTGREDPGGRDEQYERLYLVLHDSASFRSTATFYPAGEPTRTLAFSEILADLVELLAARNSDGYQVIDGRLRRT